MAHFLTFWDWATFTYLLKKSVICLDVKNFWRKIHDDFSCIQLCLWPRYRAEGKYTFKQQYRRKWSKIVALYSWSRESPNVRSRSFLNSASRRTKGPAFTSCPSSAGCNVTALDSIQNWSFSFHILFYVKIKFQLFTWYCSRCIKVHSSIEPAL